MSLIAGGDASAVAKLYDRHAATLFPIPLRIVRDRAEAEDLLHDAFVAVLERASQYAPHRGSVVAWLVILVRNLSIDRTRRRARRSALVRDELHPTPRASVRDPEHITSDASEREKLLRALATLPDVQRQTLETAFFEGLTYPEIAVRDKVPVGTIKSRAARALSSLRDALLKEGVAVDG